MVTAARIIIVAATSDHGRCNPGLRSLRDLHPGLVRVDSYGVIRVFLLPGNNDRSQVITAKYVAAISKSDDVPNLSGNVDATFFG